ncbi:MAG TPA: Uma2 family endonuclease [Terriglobia bacterium]|nr:Uma2 family endonuclease [Terriglobia bacterium]
MPVKTLITIEEYEALAEPGGERYELSEGELVVTPASSFYHNEIRDRIGFRLKAYVQEHQVGGVTMETDFKLAPHTVRRPDVAFITAEKLKGVDPRTSPLGTAPDLAIEVQSPNDDLKRKLTDYLAAGVRVWVIYPDSQTARIFKPGAEPRLVDAVKRDAVEDPDLLPGFRLILAEILDAEP